MKKLILIVAILAIVGFISQAEAATSDTCGMSVTVLVSAEVEVTDEPLAFGDVNAGQSDVNDAPGCTVTNVGSTQDDYRLQITDKPATWSVEETAASPGWEEFRLLALFTSSTPITTDFSTSDDIVLASGQTTATGDIYAITAEGASVKGYDCTKTSVRKLWFRFDAPSGTTLTTQQWITVTVYAIQG